MINRDKGTLFFCQCELKCDMQYVGFFTIVILCIDSRHGRKEGSDMRKWSWRRVKPSVSAWCWKILWQKAGIILSKKKKIRVSVYRVLANIQKELQKIQQKEEVADGRYQTLSCTYARLFFHCSVNKCDTCATLKNVPVHGAKELTNVRPRTR